MQAVILAAGRGTRLGKASEGMTKALLQVGGRPLVYHQLECLAEAGISPVAMVIGHAADLVRETVGNRAEFIFNPRYRTTNSLYSFYLTRDWIRGPVIVLNSDVLFDRELLERVLRAGEDSLAFDSSSGYAREHMKVAVENGRVVDLSKTLPPEESAGENVGILCLSRETTRRVFEVSREILQTDGTNSFLAEALRRVLRERPFRAVDAAGRPWIEIDTPFDLERARREVWPRIRDLEGTRVIGWRRRRRRRKLISAAAGLLALLSVFLGGWLLAPSGKETAWAAVPPRQAEQVKLDVKGTPQLWWRCGRRETALASIHGPQDLRIDIRCLGDRGLQDRTPYVVEVRLDGARLDWFKFRATFDPDARLPGRIVCDRDKIRIAVPEGRHVVGVRLLAGDAPELLVRFRVAEPEIPR